MLILVSSFRVLKGSLHILVEGTPDGLSLGEVAAEIQRSPAVASVHDLHVWNLCSQHIALSAHIVLQEAHAQTQADVMVDLRERLDSRFDITHTTIQFEENACADSGGCNGAGAHVAHQHAD